MEDIELGSPKTMNRRDGDDNSSPHTTSLSSPPMDASERESARPISLVDEKKESARFDDESGGSEEEEEGESSEDNESVIPPSPISNPKEKVKEKQVKKAKGSLAKAILNSLLLLLLVLAPAFLIWLSGSFETYSIYRVKATVEGTNREMEFIRVSFLLWLAMSLFMVIEWAVAVLPLNIIKFFKKCNSPVSPATKRRIGYFVSSSMWFALVFWIASLTIVGALFYYDDYFIQKIFLGFSSGATKAASNAVESIKPLKDSWYYLEKSIIVFTLFYALRAFFSYIVELIAIKHSKRSHADRVKDLNYRYKVVSSLASTLRHPGRKLKIKSRRTDIHLHKDPHAKLATEKKAQDLANIIFYQLVAPNSQVVTKDSFVPLLADNDDDGEELERVFAVFDRNGKGMVSVEEFTEAVVAIHNERFIVKKSIESNNGITKQLSVTLFFFTVFLVVTFGIPILGIEATALLVVFGMVWAGFGFLFQSAAMDAFNSFIFVFVRHAYDVGDRVKVDDELLTVEAIDIYQTIFRNKSGIAVYIPNSELSSKYIYNMRRSGQQFDKHTITLDESTTIDNVWELRGKLEEFARSEPFDYTGRVILESFDLGSNDSVVLEFLCQHHDNFQNESLRKKRHNKFLAVLVEFSQQMGIKIISTS